MRGILCFLSVLIGFGSSTVRANVVGADTQNFNPITSGLDFVTVQSSEVLAPGLVNFGLFLNYAANSLPNYSNTSGDRTNFTDSLLSADLNFGVGIMNNLDVGMSFPQLLRQTVESDPSGPQEEFAATGMTEVRANAKFRFWGDERGGLATVVSANFNRIKNNPFAGEGAGPTLNFELVGDTTLSNGVALAFNAGYRMRNPGTQITTSVIEPLPNQFIYSGAASYLLEEYDTKLIGEVFGSQPTESQASTSAKELSSLELLVGAKTDINPKLAWHAGVGTELFHGTSSPDWRIYTGINYVIGPVFDQRQVEIVRVEEKEDAVVEDFQSRPSPKGETFIAKNILFEFNSDELTEDFKASLDRFVDYVKKLKGYSMLTVEGHTDSVGKRSYNLDLSQRRADKVRGHLVRSGGLQANKVKAVGVGPDRPVADNGNFQGRALNRRVEFIIRR